MTYKDKEWLRHQYIDLGKSTTTIASDLETTSSTVSRWLKKHNIAARPIGGQSHRPDRINKEWLYNKYITEKMSSLGIAALLGVTDACIRTWLREFNIEIRSLKDASDVAKRTLWKQPNHVTREWMYNEYVRKNRTLKDISLELGVSFSTVGIWIKKFHIGRRPDYVTKRWMYNEYVQENKTQEDIASGLGVSCATVGRWIKDLGITERHHADFNHYKNPNWHGGKSFEPYCSAFSEQLKEEVRIDFDRKCFLCDMPENGRKLSVHHTDYNKMQGCNGARWHLLPLCQKHHVKTNFNRWYWFNLLHNWWAMQDNINFGMSDTAYPCVVDVI